MIVRTNALNNRTALVTGAGSGIGAATARAFATHGANVVCADLNRHSAEQTAAEIVEAGGGAVFCEADVTTASANQEMAQLAVSEFGSLDIAYFNAGILARGSILKTDVATWDKVMDVNLRSVYLGLQAVVPRMPKSGGAIAVTASVAGLRGDADMSAYTASKHAVVGLVKCAAAEFAAQNVRVNAVAPGAVATPMVGLGSVNLDPGGELANLHPLGRVATPQDIADLVVFLCSDQASFITGGIYPVDGGIMATNNPRYRE